MRKGIVGGIVTAGLAASLLTGCGKKEAPVEVAQEPAPAVEYKPVITFSQAEEVARNRIREKGYEVPKSLVEKLENETFWENLGEELYGCADAGVLLRKVNEKAGILTHRLYAAQVSGNNQTLVGRTAKDHYWAQPSIVGGRDPVLNGKLILPSELTDNKNNFVYVYCKEVPRQVIDATMNDLEAEAREKTPSSVKRRGGIIIGG